jgi:hypothetical protein
MKIELPFFKINVTKDKDCCVCHAQPGKPAVLPKGVRSVCFDCVDKVNEMINQLIDPTDAGRFHKEVAAYREDPQLSGIRKLVCDLQEEAPNRQLFCPICRMETTIESLDALESDPNPKTIQYARPYGAGCLRCYAMLRTNHPSPEAALDWWRDHPEDIFEWWRDHR